MTSHHRQRHHPEPLLRDALRQAGFAAVWSYGQDTTGAVIGEPDEELAAKTIFVAAMAGDEPTRERR